MHLEILHRAPASEARKGPPLLFLHGSYCGAWVWEENFLPYFASQGYSCHAFSLRGHGDSEGRDRLHGASLADYVKDLESVVDGLEEPPVIISHSMGGVIAQKLIEKRGEKRGLPGAVFLAPSSPYGLLGSTSWLMRRNPFFLWQLNAFQMLGNEAILPEVFAQDLFSGKLSKDRLDRYLGRVQKESARVIFDLMAPQLPRSGALPRSLVIGGDRDVFFPASEFDRTARCYGAELQILPGVNHMLMLDECWREVADRILSWIDSGIGRPAEESVSAGETREK